MAVRVKPITEAQFLSQVIQLASLRGFRTFHQRPGLTKSGRWCSAVQGSGVGFPDLIIVGHGKVYAWELKVGNGQTSPHQVAWLAALNAAGIPARVVRPGDWNEIERLLA